jgi:hypothetical protein
MKCEQHDYLMEDKTCTCPPKVAVEANVTDFPDVPKDVPSSLDEQRKLAMYAAQALSVAFHWTLAGNDESYRTVYEALLSFAKTGKHTKIPLKKI